MTDTLTQLKSLIVEDKISEAEEVLNSLNTTQIRDPDIHLQLADLCESAGLIDRFIMELNLALRDKPKDVTILKRLAVVYQDSSNFERALKYWEEVLRQAPQDEETYRELGSILEEMKDYSQAERVYQQGFEATGNQEFLRLAKSVGLASIEKDSTVESSVDTVGLAQDSQIFRFLTLFSGREGVYARQWMSSTGECGYTPIHEPFTLNVARNHLNGNYTVGTYQMRLDNTVNFIAFDIDIPKYIIPRIITDEHLWNSSIKKLHKVACSLVDVAASHGITMSIEDSGYKGRHCWLFLESPIPAKVARRFAIVLLKEAKIEDPSIGIEVFPKQTVVKGEGLGNLIKLPLGIHRKTGKRGLFVKSDGEPFPDQYAFLQEVKLVTKNEIYSYLENATPVVDTIGIGEIEKEDVSHEEATPVRKTVPSYVEEYDIERDHEVQYLILKCNVIRTLVEKLNQYHELTNEERIVLIYTMGHLKNGPLAVNTLLKRCPEVDESVFLKSRLKGNPISCPKIRMRISETTSRVDCNCHFETRLNMYPTPVLHLQGEGETTIGQGIDSLQFQRLVGEYLKVTKSLSEIQILREKFLNRLNTFFEDTGVESIKTSFGMLKRTKMPDGKVNFALEI